MAENKLQENSEKESSDVKVFVTHKAEHFEEAEKLVKALNPFGGSRLHFELSEKMPPGERWRDWIRKNVSGAHLLFFIAPKSNVDWSWPIYEAGLFEGSPNVRQDSKRIILLHRKFVEIPSPLQEFQTVKATENNIIEFLKKFFGTTTITGVEPALSVDFAENEGLLKQTAKSIVQLFKGPPPPESSFHCIPHIAIKVDKSSDITETTIPPEATIEYEKGTLAMFGLGGLAAGKSQLTWSDFQSQLGSAHVRWLVQVIKTIHVTNQGKLTPTLSTTFRDQNNKIYSPVLYQVDDEKDGSRKFHVVFIEQASEGMFINVPDTFATLLTSLTLGSRLEWEVCREFLGRLERWKFDKAEKERGCEQIGVAIANIENEAEYRKQELSKRVEDDRLFLAFESQDDVKEIKSNLNEQRELKEFLSIAGKETDLDEIRQSLEGLLDRNRKVMLKVSSRYNELLQRQ